MTTRFLNTSYGTNREAFTALDWGLFVFLTLVWGGSFLFMAIGLDSFHPGFVTFLRLGFGAIVMAVIPKAHRVKIDHADRGRIRFLGLIWLALPLTLFPIAQQWIDSATAGMLNGAMPILTAVVAAFLLRALPGKLQMIGLIVGFGGIAAVALPSAKGGSTAAIGVALVLVATVCYAVSVNMVAPLQQRYGALPVIARVQWVAVALVTPYGLYGLTQSGFSWPSLLAMLAVGIIGTGIAFVFMGSLTGRVGATRSSFITYVIPVVALILGVVFRNEAVSPVAIVGVVLVVTGALLASRKEI